MWAAQIGGGSDDPEQERALCFALTYFIGRFEGISGLNFDDWATLDLVVKVAEDQDKTADLCLPQMLSIGGRMQTWGSKIQQEAATLEDPAAGS